MAEENSNGGEQTFAQIFYFRSLGCDILRSLVGARTHNGFTFQIRDSRFYKVYILYGEKFSWNF